MTRCIPLAAALLSVLAAQDDGPREPLCRAAGNGDVAEVRALLARGANPNVRDEQGDTPLMRVARLHLTSIPDDRKNIPRDSEACARLLLDKGAGVNARNTAGRTALLISMEGFASEHGVTGADERLARLLIGHGADIDAADSQGWTPLLQTLDLWADQPALVELLLSKGANANARLQDGRSGLMLAARLGKHERLPTLIAHGADLNARNNDGATVLMVAATVQWDDAASAMMKLLTAKGANLNVTDKQGRTAADLAAQAGYLERAKFLIDSGTKVADAGAFWKQARNYSLLRAIGDGRLEIATTMLQEGADANFHVNSGRTLLMIAANEEYSAERAVLLLKHGASANLAGSGGDTPLMVAADRYQADIW